MRLILAATAAVVLLAGLCLQLLDRTVAIDLAGSALYACLVGLVVAIARPRLAGWLVAVIAFAASAAIELLQLTGVPAAVVAAMPPLRLVFGSSFDPLDLVGYAIGAVLLFAMLSAVHAVARRRSSTVSAPSSSSSSSPSAPADRSPMA